MSAFLQRKLDRLEREVASLLERGLLARAAERQNEICRLLDEKGGRDLELQCKQWVRLAEIQLDVGFSQDAQENWNRARGILSEHLSIRCPELLEASLNASEDNVGVRHRTLDYDVETARLLNRLAMLYHKTGEPSRARQLLERAMAIARPQLGVDHPDFAILLANLAGVEHSLGSFAEAESLYRQALDVLRSTLGEEHPEVAETQGELALHFHCRGRRREALHWYERALETLASVHGEDHPSLVKLLCKEAALRVETGDLTAAEWDLVRARRILRARGSEPGLQEAQVLLQLTEVYLCMEDFSRAEDAAREALEIQRRRLSEDHPEMTRHLLEILARLELLWRQNGKDQKADALLPEIEKLRRASMTEAFEHTRAVDLTSSLKP